VAYLQEIRVLLADDHRDFLRAIQSFLEPRFEVVECVENGEALFEAAMRLQPDLIVTDIIMPKLNGIEAANRLRESGCPSKIIFVTLDDDPAVVRAALEAGAFGYVLKTSLPADLLFAIGEALAGRVFVSAIVR
jgi:DNA-binding NarL/FixJ family response regulator